jgi:TonB family protein
MRKFLVFNIFISAVLLFPQIVSAQKKDRVEIFTRLVESSVKNCKNLQLGQISFYLEPDYPSEAKTARIGGSVEVTINFDEKGKFLEIEKVTGSRLLQGAASEAALKVRFSPTICNGISVPISGVITYNFIPLVVAEGYFMPAKVEDFIDVKSDSQTYEAIVNLTENYKIAFGYEDRKFYTDAPLTRGDFAHFLRLTLDLLGERAKNANKIPRQINLFYSYNPNKLTTFDKIKEIDKKSPYLDSLRVLLLKYDISLGGEKNEFDGKLPYTQNQLIDLWTKIFGAGTVPINFERTIRNEKIITRGEFAVFLQESLGVLTYKVLP